MNCYSFLSENVVTQVLNYPWTFFKIQARNAYHKRNILADKYKKFAKKKKEELLDEVPPSEENEIIFDPVTNQYYYINNDGLAVQVEIH